MRHVNRGQVIVREFVEADREALRKLFVASRDAAFSWAAVGAHKLEDFDVSTAGERILVAEHSCTPIGFASVWQDDSFLHNLFVHPHYQRCGVGRMLLAGCDKYFSAAPTLKCLKANDPAKRFYQSQGWRVCSEADGPEGPYVLMVRARPNDSLRTNPG
ncbi:TPA: GNAT family N-acetyltransferase [Stenotrophomonas maltophilia]|nr:GNAT family N-acetyltransferase [Stenotrophomonas maltophilia]